MSALGIALGLPYLQFMGGGSDTQPDQFTFVDQTNVDTASTITSAAVTLSGLRSFSPISVSGGTYNINGGAFTSSPGLVENGDQIQARNTSASTLNTAVNTVVTVGGVSDTFTSTTHAPVWAWRASDLSLAPYIGSGTPTVSRAGNTATRINSSGLLETVNANLARYDYNTSGVLQGLLVEPAATNILLNTRDKTNASWTKGVTMTAAKDQTGIDGSANAASSLTGGAVTATNTCLQTVVLASSSRVYSAWVKRLVGTGTIEMTTDGGTTWVNVTSTLAGFSGAYGRISIPAQTVTNPSSGFRITTSGDKIAVDFDQNETGVLTRNTTAPTAAAVTRNADDITLLTSGLSGFNNAVGMMYSKAIRTVAIPSATFPVTAALIKDDATFADYILLLYETATNIHGAIQSGGVSSCDLDLGAASLGSLHKSALVWKLNDFAGCLDGGTVQTDSSGAVASGIDTFAIGRTPQIATEYWGGWITDVEIYASRVDNAGVQNKTT